MAKKEMQDKKGIAEILYMQGEQGKDIAERLGISTTTVSQWVKQNQWQERRAANNINRQEIVNKCLVSIDKLLEKFRSKEDPDIGEYTSVADMVIKMSNAIEKLDKKNSIVDIMNTFSGFLNWLKARLSVDPELTPEILKTIAKYQDLYINEKLTSNA